ncbi:DUF2977 domain-containing protein [Mammaliicoccus sciuri]|uniref:DUF2977 domain-containing protein n=1 Tax=Mammaliicoccus sciuri TaxID=1296 RepID=UPI001FB397C3|nr:DUF2977 domain-containing protein [Mammaliicoccus sciuri]MCJ0907691.1 DUF2977 domain-containing protein [Mammaliicoccus sciuri]
MQIQLNANNEILAFAIIGELNEGILISDYPQNFIEDFKQLKYKYENEQIVLNENYKEVQEEQIKPPNVATPGTDEELRKMFASMQVQLVQANMMVMQLSQQNARLSQEMVIINQKLDGGSE